jgi:hypothetical protein
MLVFLWGMTSVLVLGDTPIYFGNDKKQWEFRALKNVPRFSYFVGNEIHLRLKNTISHLERLYH